MIPGITLNRTNSNKQTDDEYYTRYEDIKVFLDGVKLEGLKIYSPCDGEKSNFLKYFDDRGLTYKSTDDDMWGHDDLYRWADIVITNPPFTGFTAWIDFLRLNRKPFILIGPIMTVLGWREKTMETPAYVWGEVDYFIGPDGKKRSSRCKWYTSGIDPKRPLVRHNCDRVIEKKRDKIKLFREKIFLD